MSTFRLSVVSLGLTVLAMPAFADDIDITKALAPDATVTVINVAGEINFSTWDRSELHLTGYTDKYARLDIQENDKGIYIEVRLRDDVKRTGGSELNLTIPVGASISAESVSADITVLGSRGAKISAESVSGDIEVEAETGYVNLVSVSGDVIFSGTAPRSYGESVSGDIEFSGVSGEVSMNTVSGDGTLRAGPVNQGKFESVSGSMDLHLEVDSGGRLTVESMSGDVTLSVPGSQTGEFRAQSFSGDIRSNVGKVERGEFGPGSYLKQVEGNSGSMIRVESFSGDIQIRRD